MTTASCAVVPLIDVDGDGEMSMDEALLQGMTEQMFRDMDVDGDGRVSKEEFRAFQAKYQRRK